MSILGSLLSGVTATGARSAIPAVLSRAAVGAVPGVFGGAAASLGGGGGGGGPPKVLSTNTPVSEVQVNGTPSANTASALQQALTTGVPGLGAAAAPQFGDAGTGTAEVSPLTAYANTGRSEFSGLSDLTPVDALESGLKAGALVTPPDTSGLEQKEPGPLQPDDGSGVTPQQAGSAGLLGLLGLNPKTLLGAGILGAGLLNAGGDDNTPAGDGLTDTINRNNDLINRLQGTVSAGQSGQIGGMGMNTIARQVRHAQAAIRQRYAAMGMSGSSAEQEDLNSAVEAGVDTQFKVGQSLASQGLAAIAALTGQSLAGYGDLLKAQTARDTELGNVLANFAGSLVR